MNKLSSTIAAVMMLVLILSTAFLAGLGYFWAFTTSPTWLSALTAATLQTIVMSFCIGLTAYKISKGELP